MKLMTFNIRNAIADDGKNSWQYRKELVTNYLRNSNADIIALQEVVPSVKEQLINDASDIYSFIGEGRLETSRADDEINLVLYKTDKFRLIDKEHFWLSDTPEIAGSKYPTQKYWPRTCTLVHLQTTDNKIYTVAATHLDNEDAEAREKGLNLIISRLKGESLILLGDFNDIPQTVHKWVGKRLADLTDGLPHTYNGFGQDTSKKIDYIFTSNNIKLVFCKCDKIKNNRLYISDHYPVYTEVQ